MKVLRTVGILLAVAVGGLLLLYVLAPFHDGPIGLFPGGPLRAGDLVEAPVEDWSFATAVETIELQLAAEERSRTTWVLVLDGTAFIPCSLEFPPAKRWHRLAAEDGRAWARIEGRRYPVSLARIDDEERERRLAEVLRGKYRAPAGNDSGVWYFRVTSRAD